MIREYEKMETPFKRDDKTKKINELIDEINNLKEND